MKFAAIALLGAAQAKSFPGFDSFHAHCEMEVKVNDTCENAYSSVKAMVDNSDDPAKGFYSLFDHADNKSVWATRTGPGKKYTDDVMWEFTSVGTECNVHSKSRSQSLSYWDSYFNFCNQYNAYRSDSFKLDFLQNPTSISNCKFQPSLNKAALDKACNEGH